MRTLDCVLRAASCVLTSPHLTVLRLHSTSDARKQELRPLPLVPLVSLWCCKSKMREAKPLYEQRSGSAACLGKGRD